jgi:hypothetical protein
MTKNVGGIDKIARIIAGLIIIIAGLIFRSWWGIIGLVPLLTAIFNYCPAYLPFGISSCKTKKTANT